MKKAFALGTRVVVSKDGGWQRDAKGVVVAGPEVIQTLQGEDYYWWVEFEEPERDINGPDQYRKAQILSRYITAA